MIYWLVFLMLLAGPAVAENTYSSYRDSIGQTHFNGKYNGERYSGTSRKDSIGQTHTDYSNGARCIGRNVSRNRYTESCH